MKTTSSLLTIFSPPKDGEEFTPLLNYLPQPTGPKPTDGPVATGIRKAGEKLGGFASTGTFYAMTGPMAVSHAASKSLWGASAIFEVGLAVVALPLLLTALLVPPAVGDTIRGLADKIADRVTG